MMKPTMMSMATGAGWGFLRIGAAAGFLRGDRSSAPAHGMTFGRVDYSCRQGHVDDNCSHEAIRMPGKARKSIGDQELALLQHLSEHGEASVGEVAAAFGEPRGLARSTVLTMMERLRAKAYLRRRQVAGVYRYAAVAQSDDVMRSAVGSFVEKTLQGSLSPFVAWMSQRSEVSDDELAELEALVANLQSKRKEG
jgi:predicted transcriptional regulator